MFEQYVADLKAIRDAVSEARFGDALRASSRFTGKLADLYDLITGNNPPTVGGTGDAGCESPEFDKELAATEAELTATRANPTVGANPLAILAAIKAGIELAKMIRDLLRKRNEADQPGG